MTACVALVMQGYALPDLLDERAASLGQRTERLLRGDRRADLVVVPRTLRLRRLLHLDEISRVDLASVGADRALAEQRVVGRLRFHVRDDLRAVVALQRLDRLQV